jgi:hypothetical protein
MAPGHDPNGDPDWLRASEFTDGLHRSTLRRCTVVALQRNTKHYGAEP